MTDLTTPRVEQIGAAWREGYGVTLAWGSTTGWPATTLATLGALPPRAPLVVTDDQGDPVATWMYTAAEVLEAVGGQTAARLTITTGAGNDLRVVGDGWMTQATVGRGDRAQYVAMTRYIMGPSGGAGAVLSVQGKVGAVVLTASDVGAATTAHVHAPADVTGTAVVTADPRLSDARTPTAHAATHAAGGTDAVTVELSQVTQSGATAGQVPAWSGTAWTPTTPATGGGGGAPFPSSIRPGRAAVWPWGPSQNVSMWTDRVVLVPLLVTTPFSFTSATFRVATAAAGSTASLAIYTLDTAGTTLTRVVDFGLIDSATIGDREVTVSATLAAADWYWVGMKASANGVALGGSVVSYPSPVLSPTSASPGVLYQALDIYGCANAPTIAVPTNANFELWANTIGAPRVVFRGVTLL